jgi:hypothetical protein
MTAIVAHETKVSNNFRALAERRADMIMRPEVLEILNANERIAANAGTKLPIRVLMNTEEDEQRLIRTLSALFQALCNMLGIKDQLTKEDAYSFYDILKTYYSDLTPDEVKIAFEMMMIGQLDTFLPKDKFGEPEKRHYQSFSIEYITRILGAYRKYRDKIWGKCYQLLPETTEVSQEEKHRFKRDLIESIHTEYAKFIKGESITFMAPFLVLDEFERRGIISGRKHPTDEMRKNAREIVLKFRARTAIERNQIIRDEEKGYGSTKVLGLAQHNANMQAIAEVFAAVRDSNYTIEELIK